MKNAAPLISAACVLAAFGLTACTTTHEARVDAISNPEIEVGHAYRVVPRNPLKADADASYDEASRLVKNALSAKGMYEADDPEAAEVVIEIDYGVGPKREIVSTPPPELKAGAVPLPSESSARANTYDPFTNQVIGPRGRGSPPSALRPIHAAPLLPIDTDMPLEDDKDEFEVRTVYEKYVTIVAKKPVAETDGSGEKTEVEVWRVEVRIEDEAAEVEPLLPVLVAAAVDRMGSNSNTAEIVRISDKDEVVTFVKSDS